MPKNNAPILSFIGGEIGELMAARLDVESYPTAAALMDNWLPYAQGPMRRRPPLLFTDNFPSSTNVGKFFPFNFEVDENYLILANAANFYFWRDDVKLTLPAVTAAITNGTFDSGSTGWTDTSETGSSASVVNNEMTLVGDGANEAAVEQSVTINEVDTLHVLRFTVVHGPLNIRIGTTSGGFDLAQWTLLDHGLHQIEFTPGVSPV